MFFKHRIHVIYETIARTRPAWECARNGRGFIFVSRNLGIAFKINRRRRPRLGYRRPEAYRRKSCQFSFPSDPPPSAPAAVLLDVFLIKINRLTCVHIFNRRVNSTDRIAVARCRRVSGRRYVSDGVHKTGHETSEMYGRPTAAAVSSGL